MGKGRPAMRMLATPLRAVAVLHGVEVAVDLLGYSEWRLLCRMPPNLLTPPTRRHPEGQLVALKPERRLPVQGDETRWHSTGCVTRLLTATALDPPPLSIETALDKLIARTLNLDILDTRNRQKGRRRS
jgi:hypothetical protein